MKITFQQANKISMRKAQLRMCDCMLQKKLKNFFGKERTADLTDTEAQKLLNHLNHLHKKNFFNRILGQFKSKLKAV